jgi:hypothetical protein
MLSDKLTNRLPADDPHTLCSHIAYQYGVYPSVALPPGKYHTLASTTPLDKTPESIAKLWHARLRAKEVAIGPGEHASVTLQPTSID